MEGQPSELATAEAVPDKPVTLAELVEAFTSEHQETIAEAQGYFRADSLTDFLKLTPILHNLLDQYQKEVEERLNQHWTSLPKEALSLIIDRDYILGKENHYRELGNKYGIALSFEELGGGDWLEEIEGGLEMGQIRIFDFSGHGEMALWPKALVLRFLELWRQLPEADRGDLFVELDKSTTPRPSRRGMTGGNGLRRTKEAGGVHSWSSLG